MSWEKVLIWKQQNRSGLGVWGRQEGDSFAVVFFFSKFPYPNFPFPHVKPSISCVLIIQFEAFWLGLDFIDLGVFVGSTTNHQQGLRMDPSQPKPYPVTARVQEASPIATSSRGLLSPPKKNDPKQDANLQANVLYKKKKNPLEWMDYSGFPLAVTGNVNEITGCFFCRELWSVGFQIWAGLW